MRGILIDWLIEVWKVLLVYNVKLTHVGIGSGVVVCWLNHMKPVSHFYDVSNFLSNSLLNALGSTVIHSMKKLRCLVF